MLLSELPGSCNTAQEEPRPPGRPAFWGTAEQCWDPFTLDSRGSFQCPFGCPQLPVTPARRAAPFSLFGRPHSMEPLLPWTCPGPGYLSATAFLYFPHKVGWAPGWVIQTPNTVHTSCYLQLGLVHPGPPSDTEHTVLHMVRSDTYWTNSFSSWNTFCEKGVKQSTLHLQSERGFGGLQIEHHELLSKVVNHESTSSSWEEPFIKLIRRWLTGTYPSKECE